MSERITELRQGPDHQRHPCRAKNLRVGDTFTLVEPQYLKIYKDVSPSQAMTGYLLTTGPYIVTLQRKDRTHGEGPEGDTMDFEAETVVWTIPWEEFGKLEEAAVEASRKAGDLKHWGDAPHWEVQRDPDNLQGDEQRMFRVCWSEKDAEGKTLAIGHYPGTSWGENAAHNDAHNKNSEGRRPESRDGWTEPLAEKSDRTKVIIFDYQCPGCLKEFKGRGSIADCPQCGQGVASRGHAIGDSLHDHRPKSKHKRDEYDAAKAAVESLSKQMQNSMVTAKEANEALKAMAQIEQAKVNQGEISVNAARKSLRAVQNALAAPLVDTGKLISSIGRRAKKS